MTYAVYMYSLYWWTK